MAAGYTRHCGYRHSSTLDFVSPNRRPVYLSATNHLSHQPLAVTVVGSTPLDSHRNGARSVYPPASDVSPSTFLSSASLVCPLVALLRAALLILTHCNSPQLFFFF